MCSTFVYLLFSLEAPGVTPAQDAMPRGGGEKTLLKILRWMREPYTCFDPHCEHPKKSQKKKKLLLQAADASIYMPAFIRDQASLRDPRVLKRHAFFARTSRATPVHARMSGLNRRSAPRIGRVSCQRTDRPGGGGGVSVPPELQVVWHRDSVILLMIVFITDTTISLVKKNVLYHPK